MILLPFVVGAVAGLRTLTPLAVVSWAAYFGWLPLQETWLAFLGFAATPYIITVLAVAELVNDKLPKTPSRKVPAQFGARVMAGALCGTALSLPAGLAVAGLIGGAVGAVAGTLGGAALRARLAAAFGKDLPAALLEDVVAVGGALLIVSRIV